MKFRKFMLSELLFIKVRCIDLAVNQKFQKLQDKYY